MTITCSRAQSKNDRSSGARSRTRPRVGAGGRWWVAGWMLLAIVGRRCGDASALGPASWQWSQQRRWGACSWFSSLAGSGETERDPMRGKKTRTTEGTLERETRARCNVVPKTIRTLAHALFPARMQRPEPGMRHSACDTHTDSQTATKTSTPRQHSTHTPCQACRFRVGRPARWIPRRYRNPRSLGPSRELALSNERGTWLISF